ncbi:hypothetical protein ACFX12_029135 [Malus domestica]
MSMQVNSGCVVVENIDIGLAAAKVAGMKYTVEDDFQHAKAVFDFIGDPRRSDLTGDSSEDGPPSTIPWMVFRVSAKISYECQYAFGSNPDVDIPVDVQISSSRAFIGESLGGELLQGAFYC